MVVRVTAGTMSRRPAVRWLVIAVFALLGAWLLAPAAVAIYDGIGNPDEPYRWVQSPTGTPSKKAPTTATVDLPVAHGVSGAGYANTKETGPQISVYFPAGALRVSGGATSVTVTAKPMAPSGPAPSDGSFVSNVYQVTATAGGADVPIVGKGNQAPTLQMRAASVTQPGPVFERFANGRWTQGKTLRVGNDIYQIQASALGDWALVRPKAAASTGGSGGINVGLLAAGVGVLVLAGVIATVRTKRMREVAG
jgi:hypothetical protein